VRRARPIVIHRMRRTDNALPRLTQITSVDKRHLTPGVASVEYVLQRHPQRDLSRPLRQRKWGWRVNTRLGCNGAVNRCAVFVFSSLVDIACIPRRVRNGEGSTRNSVEPGSLFQTFLR
jgi:hypothetical protein